MNPAGIGTANRHGSNNKSKDRPRLLPLRGRDEQIAQLNVSLQAVAHQNQSKVLLVKAGPGSGKTRLLLESVNLAARSNFAVVNGSSTFLSSAHGTPRTTADIPYARRGGLDDAFGPASPANALKDLRTGLREALEHGPTLVALDDLHLIDMSVLMAVRDLVAHLSGRPVLWVLAFGSEELETSRGPTDLFLGKLRTEQMPELTALTGEALAQLVADHLGATPDPAVIEMAESIGDSPRAVIELVRGLVADGDLCITDNGAQLLLPRHEMVNSSGRIQVPAPVPPRFAAMAQQKLRPLSPFTAKVLKLAAILGSPFTPADLSAMLDESPVDLLTALDEAFGHGILFCRMNDFAFRSDAIWRVILDSVPPPMGVLLRKQAATMLLTQPNGVEAAAVHLVHVAQPGDIEAVRIISTAATRLLMSDPATAASLAMRGMELLKPEEDEHVRLAAAAVEAFVRAGDPALAVKAAEETIAQATDLGRAHTSSHAAAIAALRSWLSVALLLQGKVHEAGRAASDALAVSAGEPEQRERLGLIQLAAEFLTDDSAAARHAEEILALPAPPAPAVMAGALTIRACERWRSGQVNDAIELLRDASDADRGSQGVQLLDPQWILCSILTKIGEFEDATSVAKAAARKFPEIGMTAVSALLQAPMHLAKGHLDDAERSARTGIEAMVGLCVPMLAPQAWRVRALVALRRGLLAEAEEHLHVLERQFPRDSSRPWWAMRFLLAAQVAEAKSGAQAAIELLAEIWASAGGRRELLLEDPSAAACCVRWALESGAPDIAHIVVDTAKALRTGNRNLHALRVGALHAQALLDGDLDALTQASHSHRDPWAQATAAEDRARLLLTRDDREAAIVELEKVLSTYSALGGERDTARVRRDLRQLGVRRRHWKHAKRPVSGWDSLTNAERRVAELVANGLTNRQVANELFVSPHTVGFHLRQVYRKLSLRSRVDLIRLKF